MSHKSARAYFVGVAMGFVAYSAACSGVGVCCSKINQVRLGNSVTVHAHHWLLHVVLLSVLLAMPVRVREAGLLRGLVVSGIVHGLAYDDWHKFTRE